MDMICRKTMTRCLTPGMCSPHGGCREPFNPDWDRGEAAQESLREHMEIITQLKAEIEAFKAANAELSEINVARRNHLSNAKKAAGIGPMDDLVGAIEALRKSDERYQWLRSRIPGSAYRIAGVIYSEGGLGVDSGIDAAMSKESSQ